MLNIPDTYDTESKVLTINLRNRDFSTCPQLIKYIANELDIMRGPVKTGLLIFEHLIPKREVIYKLYPKKGKEFESETKTLGRP